jgi:integrase
MKRQIPFTIVRNKIFWFNKRHGSTYIRLSLGTCDPHTALAFASHIATNLRRIKHLDMTPYEVKRLVREWLEEQTIGLERLVATVALNPGKNQSLTIGNPTYLALRKSIQNSYDKANKALELGLWSEAVEEAKRFAQNHIEDDTSEEDLALLTRELLLAKRELSDNLLQHRSNSLTPLSPPQSADDIGSTDPISTVWKSYINELIKGNRLKESSEKLYNDHFAKLVDILGDVPINTLDKAKARKLKTGLMDYPLRRFTGKRAELTLSEARQTIVKRISNSSASTAFSAITGFLGWAAGNGYLPSNPLEGMTIKRNKGNETRLSYNTDQLRHIFSQPRFQGLKQKGQRSPVYEDDYWLPLLALHTGARMEELCRLRKKDIYIDGAIPCFQLMDPEIAPELTDRNRKHSGKSINAFRMLPIHMNLWDNLGFKEFVDSKPEGYLFTLKPVDRKMGHNPSNDFSTFKSKLGFTKDHAFHSFRHTLRDALTAANVSGEFVKAIVGHSNGGDVTFGQYGTRLSKQPTVLAQHLYRVDFSHILTEVKAWSEIEGMLYKRVIK